jgi:cell division protein FtsL
LGTTVLDYSTIFDIFLMPTLKVVELTNFVMSSVEVVLEVGRKRVIFSENKKLVREILGPRRREIPPPIK